MLPLYDERFPYAKAHLLADMKQAWEVHTAKSLGSIGHEYYKRQAEIWRRRYDYLSKLIG